MKQPSINLLALSLLLILTTPAIAEEPAEAQAAEQAAAQAAEQAEAASVSMLEEAEHARQAAKAMRAEALKAAELARKSVREYEQMAREQAELSRMDDVEVTRALAMRDEEMSRAREELSRAHRELREASREVARAHRELAMHGEHPERHVVTRRVNLGDRAVIGVVLGKQTDQGVEVIGVSPDGPSDKAGLMAGDVLVSIRGADLAGAGEAAGSALRDVMAEVSAGEELAVVALRNGEPREFTVTAEHREPRSWQSMIRIPDAEEIEIVEGEPGSSRIIVERLEIPEIDEVALAARVEELTERLKSRKLIHVSPDGDHVSEFEILIEDFSDMGGHAMSEADIWFGLPNAHGLELTGINAGLGSYFKTDRGVLVIKAREGNAYQLESGDVVLAIDANPVDSPADMMRALRQAESGSEIELTIKRNRGDKTLKVQVPDNRLGQR